MEGTWVVSTNCPIICWWYEGVLKLGRIIHFWLKNHPNFRGDHWRRECTWSWEGASWSTGRTPSRPRRSWSPWSPWNGACRNPRTERFGMVWIPCCFVCWKMFTAVRGLHWPRPYPHTSRDTPRISSWCCVPCAEQSMATAIHNQWGLNRMFVDSDNHQSFIAGDLPNWLQQWDFVNLETLRDDWSGKEAFSKWQRPTNTINTVISKTTMCSANRESQRIWLRSDPFPYFSGLNFREHPHKIWPYLALTYLHFRILKISHWISLTLGPWFVSMICWTLLGDP